LKPSGPSWIKATSRSSLFLYKLSRTKNVFYINPVLKVRLSQEKLVGYYFFLDSVIELKLLLISSCLLIILYGVDIRAAIKLSPKCAKTLTTSAVLDCSLQIEHKNNNMEHC
jgi:hypothetical protein